MERLQIKAAETGLFSILFWGGIIEIIHGSCLSVFLCALIRPYEREQSPACVNFAAYEPEQDPFQTRAHGGTQAEMRFCAQNCWI